MAKSFHELSSKSQLVILGMLSVLTAVGAWQVLLGPMRSDLVARNARVTQVQLEVNRAEAVAKKLPIVQKEIAALEQSLIQTTAVLPDEKDPQDVLRNLNELASESALDISTFTPKKIETKAQYSEWPIEVGLEGGYHDLGRFFDRIAAMSRLMSVSDLKIKARTKPDGHGTITATCIATTFVFRKEIAPTAPGGKS